MTIYINRSVRDHVWGGGAHAINALHRYAPSMGMQLAQGGTMPSVILVMGLDGEDGHASLEDALRVREFTNGRTKVVLRLNDNDARKGTSGLDQRVIAASSQLDGTIFVSQWMHDTFIKKGWACKRNTVIINGCEASRSSAFDPRIGGQISIVSHHWSDNIRKSGCVTEWLDDFVGKSHGHPEFSLTFIGRTKVKLKNSVHIQPLYGQALWDELGQHSVYVSESLWDPGPNHVLEALALGIPTYVHGAGGGCVEFAGSDHTYNDINELERIILSRCFEPNTQGVKVRPWRDFATDVFNFIKEVKET